MRALLTLGLLASAAVPLAPNAAEDWQDFAMVSTTMGTQMNRLCAGADDSDIGCPSYAPSLTTAGDVSVTGNLSAVKFIGDGSALTGLTTSGDRIVSGTSSIIVSESGHISFTTAGTERMVINASGNVGIGTTAPSAPLHISATQAQIVFTTASGGKGYVGRLSDDNIYLWNNSPSSILLGTSNTERVRIASSGNVGIGDTTPMRLLTLRGDADAPSGVFAGGKPLLRLEGSGSWSEPMIEFAEGGYDPIAAIAAKNDDGAAGDLILLTRPDAGVLTERLRVRGDNGNVGIGTTNPNAKLDVNGTISATALYVTGTTGTVSATYGYFTNISGSGAGLHSIPASAVTGLSTPDRIVSGTSHVIVSDSAAVTVRTNGSDRLAVDSSGRVGIGTVSPRAVLDVSGALAIGGGSGNAVGAIELGGMGRTSNDNVYIDFTGDATYTDYGLRIIRTSAGANAPSYIYHQGTGMLGLNTMGVAPLVFSTSSTERMRVHSDGNVGIGVSAPSTKLHIRGATSNIYLGDTLEGFGSGTTWSGGMYFGPWGGTASHTTAGIEASWGSSTTPQIHIGTLRNGGANSPTYMSAYYTGLLTLSTLGTERMRINNIGNVGIGTTAPGQTLDVSGTVRIVSRTIIGSTATPSATLQVSGSLLLAGSDSTTCNDAYIGILRRNPTTGRLQVCK